MNFDISFAPSTTTVEELKLNVSRSGATDVRKSYRQLLLVNFTTPFLLVVCKRFSEHVQFGANRNQKSVLADISSSADPR